MIIPRCARCLGVFIFWESILGSAVIYSVTALHLPPGKRDYIKSVSKEILKRVPQDVPSGKPYLIILGGGKIDSPKNKFFYKNSLRHYILPLKRNFPGIEIQIVSPEKNTMFTNLTLNKQGEVEATQYYIKN
ncbi:MAG TPA: hypothetical protein PLQ20_01230 [Candidatus Paceibacterota bacterium]|nr:hypothetical protein [Candidatus Paceibacterota bacterium]